MIMLHSEQLGLRITVTDEDGKKYRYQFFGGACPLESEEDIKKIQLYPEHLLNKYKVVLLDGQKTYTGAEILGWKPAPVRGKKKDAEE